MATSSGEAELYALGSGCSEGLALVNLLQELRLLKNVKPNIRTDSTAAKSITTRSGPGSQPKHIHLRFHDAQELVCPGLLVVKHVDGKETALMY